MRKLFPALALAVAAFLGSHAAHAQQVNAQTGTTYTVLNTDCDPNGRKLITLNNAAGVAVTLPQAGLNGNFIGGCLVQMENISPIGAVTLTPTTSTVDGFASITIPPNNSVSLVNDSTAAATGNYWVLKGNAGAGGQSYNNFRNVLDNGAIQVAQRGTAAQTCGTTTIPETAYSADRWGCNVNVTSGAGSLQVTTAAPTGFTNAELFYRTSGALLQPQCTMQEVPTTRATTLAGQTVTLSFYAKALAAMVTDNGGVMNAYLFTGTGSDQGLQSFTASPAITPAWTGIASTLTKAFTLTTSYARYSYTAAIPSGTTEAAVAMCWTPTSASGAGATDGFDFAGVQLEQGAVPSSFEFKPFGSDLAEALRYYWTVTEPANAVAIGAGGTYTAATTCQVQIPMPAVMRVAPAVGFLGNALSATTWAIIANSTTPIVLASTWLVQNPLNTLSANSPTMVSLQATTASKTAGFGCFLVGAGGGSILTFGSDF